MGGIYVVGLILAFLLVSFEYSSKEGDRVGESLGEVEKKQENF